MWVTYRKALGMGLTEQAIAKAPRMTVYAPGKVSWHIIEVQEEEPMTTAQERQQKQEKERQQRLKISHMIRDFEEACETHRLAVMRMNKARDELALLVGRNAQDLAGYIAGFHAAEMGRENPDAER